MRRRTWLHFALAGVVLGPLLPGPDAALAKPRLAYLLVREWLTDPQGSPLRAWVRDGRAPLLQVELRQSPPLVDEAQRADKQQQYARCATEWAAARSAAGLPTVLDAQRGVLVVLVRVGSKGVRAELSLPDGTPAIFTADLPSPSRLLLLYLATALLILFVVAIPWRGMARRPTSSA